MRGRANAAYLTWAFAFETLFACFHNVSGSEMSIYAIAVYLDIKLK